MSSIREVFEKQHEGKFSVVSFLSLIFEHALDQPRGAEAITPQLWTALP